MLIERLTVLTVFIYVFLINVIIHDFEIHTFIDWFGPVLPCGHQMCQWKIHPFTSLIFPSEKIPGWWLGHPSEKYEFVNWDDDINPIFLGK